VRTILVLVLVLGCSRRTPIESCSDDLSGAWRDASDRRWSILDDGKTLEVFPIFTDGDPAAPADVVAAPRVMDVSRTPGGMLAGTVHRRYTRRANTCDAHAPIHVTTCNGDGLELVLADPAPPQAFGPCSWAATPPSRVEHWHRE
jgi:hypothetical protein